MLWLVGEQSYGYIATRADEAAAKELKAELRPRSQTQAQATTGPLAPRRASDKRVLRGTPKAAKARSSDGGKAKAGAEVREACPPPKTSTDSATRDGEEVDMGEGGGAEK